MKKIAFFVEGQTEQIFVEKLIKEMFDYNQTTVISKRTQGGGSKPKQQLVRNASFSRKPRYQFLIYDCGSDNRVKSEILDNVPNLKEAGYSYIVGLRDLYPLTDDDLPRLESGLRFVPNHIKKKYQDPFEIVIAVQEIETWFLAETRHFQKVDRRLEGSFINKRLGFNPYAIDPLERRHPSKDLNDIYRLVNKSYTKKYWQVQRLVGRLDFDHILRHLRYTILSLNELITILEKFRKE